MSVPLIGKEAGFKMFRKHKKSIFIFILISLVLYSAYYFAFDDVDTIFESFFLNLAFLPIYVLFTTFILDELLSMRERPMRIRKKNTAIGLFYSEMGETLLKELSYINKNTHPICSHLLISENWTKQDFTQAKRYTSQTDFELAKNDLEDIKAFLGTNREFLLSLLQNSILAEDQSFNHLILSVFHLQQELVQRSCAGPLSEEDYQHLTVDIKRVYTALIIEWLNYMEHISVNHPHLYSLEIRVNPFRQLSQRV